MKNQLISFLLVLSGIGLNAQDLTCADFQSGEFYIPTTEELKKLKIIKNDSIQEFTFNLDPLVTKTVVIRKKGTQTEWKNGIGNGEPFHEIIEWIDDCTYRLTFDESKMELDEMKKWVNNNNGIVVSKRKIENNCMFYIATMTANSGEALSQNGVICKE